MVSHYQVLHNIELVGFFFFYLLLGIQIGFARPAYSFDEPVFESVVFDIVLVREGGRLSEQTFQVIVHVSDSGIMNTSLATLDSFFGEDRADYKLTSPTDFIIWTFPPNRQNITIPLILFDDYMPEGTEAFRATSTSTQYFFPNFGPPSAGGAFESTDVFIIDDDCNWPVKCVQNHAIMLVSFL